jgi:hypothetical protein
MKQKWIEFSCSSWRLKYSASAINRKARDINKEIEDLNNIINQGDLTDIDGRLHSTKAENIFI